MLRFLVTFFLLGLTAPLSWAQHTPVAELFVSQNCPACPKAQENMEELSEGDVPFLQLVWVVDYWDYLGEPDEMAIPQSAYRQRVYADNLRLRGPYTPQLIVDGVDHTPGNRKRSVRNLLRTHGRATHPVTLELVATENGFAVSGARVDGEIDAEVMSLTVSEMERYGLNIRNTVTRMESLGPWTGGTHQFATDCADRCIALVQETNTGEIYGAMEYGPGYAMASGVSPEPVPVVEQ